MPRKSERRVTLPTGLAALLSQREVETYYGVSDWQIVQWIKAGMPTEPFVGRQRRFDLAKVRRWMAQQCSHQGRGQHPLRRTDATHFD